MAKSTCRFHHRSSPQKASTARLAKSLQVDIGKSLAWPKKVPIWKISWNKNDVMLNDETCTVKQMVGPSLSNLYVFSIHVHTNMLHVFCLYCMHAPINLSLPDFIRVRLVTDWNRNRSSPFAYRDEVFSRGAFVAVATVLVGPGGLVFMLGMAHMNSIHIHIFFIMFKRNCQDTQGNHHLGYFSKNVSRQVLRVVLRKTTPLTSFDVDLPHEVNPIIKETTWLNLRKAGRRPFCELSKCYIDLLCLDQFHCVPTEGLWDWCQRGLAKQVTSWWRAWDGAKGLNWYCILLSPPYMIHQHMLSYHDMALIVVKCN